MELSKKQEALLHTQCPVCEESELSALDSVGEDEPFLWCPNCESTIDKDGEVERGCVSEFIFDVNVCPSSLNEWGKPAQEGETDHRWDDTTSPITCAECGAEKE